MSKFYLAALSLTLAASSAGAEGKVNDAQQINDINSVSFCFYVSSFFIEKNWDKDAAGFAHGCLVRLITSATGQPKSRKACIAIYEDFIREELVAGLPDHREAEYYVSFVDGCTNTEFFEKAINEGL